MIKKDLVTKEKKMERALRLVKNSCVKLHYFHPSGRVLWTVVGHEGDQLVDPDIPYCSCKDFYFKFFGGEEECYHLLALRLSKENGEYDKVNMKDEEYSQFIRLLLKSLWRKIK